MKPFPSDDLIIRFNLREYDAITGIYNEYYPLLYHYVRTLTGNSFDTKDLVSESFIKLLKYKGEFQSLANIKFFLLDAAKKTFLDYLKQNKNRQFLSYRLQIHEEADLVYTFEKAEQSALFKKLVFDFIEHLPKHRRLIFKLYYYLGLKNREISSLLGISEKTVSNQKIIARKILKMKIRKEPDIFTIVESLFLFLSLIYTL